MHKIFALYIALAAISLPLAAAAAEPITLKLSFFGSERISTYIFGIKPFVDAINTEGKGSIEIEVYFDGALGKTQAQQPQIVADGVADIAFIVPGATPYRFPDNELLELPGMFADTREGTLVYSRLIAANALRGYQDFIVIAAYTPDPVYIHSRKPLETLASLKGQRINANNPVAAAALERLGAAPTILDMRQLTDAVGRGVIDGTALSPAGLLQFDVSQLTTNHYLLGVGTAPLALVMNRKTFDRLPETAQALVKKYSGEWMAANWIASFGAAERKLRQNLRSSPERIVVEPSPSDLATARKIYRTMIDSWAAESPRNRELMKFAESELERIRTQK